MSPGLASESGLDMSFLSGSVRPILFGNLMQYVSEQVSSVVLVTWASGRSFKNGITSTDWSPSTRLGRERARAGP